MNGRPSDDGIDYDHPAERRRAPPATCSLALAAAPLALAYALGHPHQTAAALTAFAVLAVARGQPGA